MGTFAYDEHRHLTPRRRFARCKAITFPCRRTYPCGRTHQVGPLPLNQVVGRRGTPSTSLHCAKGFVRARLLTDAKRFLEAPSPRPRQFVSVHNMTNSIRERFVHPRHRQDQNTSGDIKKNISLIISYQEETYGANGEPQRTPEDPKSRQSGDTRRLKEGFWLSKAVGFVIALTVLSSS